MAFENSFKTTQTDARGRAIYKDRDSGAYFTIDPKSGQQVVGRPGTSAPVSSASKSTSSGSSGSGSDFNIQQYIDQQFKNIPSAADEARRLESERESRLQDELNALVQSQGSYIEGLKGRSNLEDLYGQLREDRGVTAQEDRIRGLGQQTSSVLELLRQLPESVNQRTAGTFTTEAQRQGIEAKERQPLAQDLQSLGNLLTGERSGLQEVLQGIGQQLSLRQAQEARAIEPLAAQLQFAGQRYSSADQSELNRLKNILSGFQSDQGTSLQRALSSIGAQQTMQQQEADRLAAEIARQFQASESQKTRDFTAGQNLTGFEQDKELARLQSALRASSEKASTLGSDSPEVQAWVNEILQGNANIGNVPGELKNTVNYALNAQRSNQSKLADALSASQSQSSGGYFAPSSSGVRVRDVVRELGGMIGGLFSGGGSTPTSSYPTYDQNAITPTLIPQSLY